MDHALLILVFLIGVALLFDFLNGLHDAANSIATIVATRVLPPIYAVGWAAFFNFIAFLFFGLHVADTIGRGIISPDVISDQVIFGALMGAISWNVITWLGGIPSSSSHALIGGLLGAGIAKAGTSAVVIAGVLKTVGAIFMSPAIGFLLALLLVLIVSWLFAKANPNFADRVFRGLQFVSASAYSLGHGGNDAQKTMGIIAILLYSRGMLGGEFHVPFWAPCSAAGRSFTPWDRALRGLAPSRVSALRRAGPSPCSRRPAWAFRCRPPIPSPAPSSAWARPSASRPCAGAWRAASSQPGSSPCRPPRPSAPCSTFWAGCS